MSSTSFSMNALQMIDKAFRRIGKGSEGEAISPRMYEDGLSCLNLILKSKIGTSDHLSLRTEGTVSLVANQPSYPLSSPLRVTSVRRLNSSGYEVPLNAYSREEYFDTPNKTASPSVPVAYYFDPQGASGTLYVWPAPDTSAVSEYTLKYTYLRRPNDMVGSTDALDMPQEWTDPLIWMLADDLEVEYPCNDARLAMKVSAKAAEGKALLSNWDTESTSIYVQPDTGY